MIGGTGNTSSAEEQKIAELETLIATSAATHDDPLALHDQFCTLLARHPHRLLPALECATRTFATDPRYPNDPRHLRLWLAYARHCRRPEDVFAFLAERGIGRALAGFYEEWAWVMGREEGPAAGLRILKLGIERGAQPLERLKKKYEELSGVGGAREQPRDSWGKAEMTSWTADSSQPGMKKEIGRYSKQLIEQGQLSFEEARARVHLTRLNSAQKQDTSCDSDDSEELAHAVNPDDLTHISVYKDTTADVREMAKMANKAALIDVADNQHKDVMMLAEGTNRSFPIPESIPRIKSQLGNRLQVGDSDKTMTPIELGGHKYFVEQALGSRTFLAVNLMIAAEVDARVVLKRVEHREVAVIASLSNSTSILPPIKSIYLYNDCAVIAMKYLELGSLCRLLRMYDQKHRPVDNRIVLFFTRCLLKILIQLHVSGWICNSISLNSILITSSESELSPAYQPDGSGGWGERGLVLSGMAHALSADHDYITPSSDNPVGHELDWRAVAHCIMQLLHIDDAALLSPQWRQLLDILNVHSVDVAMLHFCIAQIDSILAASTNPSLKALLVRQEMMLLN